MVMNILPSYPYELERATILAGLLLDGAHDIPPQSVDVLASLMVCIVNSRPEHPQWSWLELYAAISSAIDCGESDDHHLLLDSWFDLLHSSGLEVAATAVDSTPMPRCTASEVRSSAIRVVALPSIRALCGQMEV